MLSASERGEGEREKQTARDERAREPKSSEREIESKN
jgi:hypothetical protein